MRQAALALSEGQASAPARTVADAPLWTNVALTDRFALMSAVKEGLERLDGEPPLATGPAPASLTSPTPPTSLTSPTPLGDGLRQCVAALDQLLSTMVRELARRCRLELEVFDPQTGPSQARAELAGTAHHQALHGGLTGLPNR